MAHVKIYGRRDVWQDRRGSVSGRDPPRWSSAPGDCPQDKRFHRFLLLDADDLVAPRGKDYLVVEILCFTGRSREARRALIAAFYDDVAPTLGLSADDLEVDHHREPAGELGHPGRLGRRAVAGLPRRRLNGRLRHVGRVVAASCPTSGMPRSGDTQPEAPPARSADSRSATPSLR